MLFRARAARHIPATPTPVSAEVERAWIAGVRAGDEAAFQALFEAYYATLCEFVQSYVRSVESAEELVQTVFFRIWEHRAAWQPVAGVRPYLFAACRNQALGVLKHERVVARAAEQVTRGEVTLGASGAGAPPDEVLQHMELSAALREAVQELPERRRMVVILRWQHQMSYAEIASALGISVKTVEVQMSRALAGLRKRLAAHRP